MRRTKQDAEQTREDIFRAGIKVFASKGYAAATLTDVAKEAGVTRGAIYWHFKSKADFFVETTKRLQSFYEELTAPELVEDRTTTEFIADTVVRVVRRFVHDPEFRLMQELVVRETLAQHNLPGECPLPRDEKYGPIVAMFAEAIAQGEITDAIDPETAYLALNGMMAGVFLMIIDLDLTPTDHQIRQIAAFVARGFAPGGERGTGSASHSDIVQTGRANPGPATQRRHQ